MVVGVVAEYTKAMNTEAARESNRNERRVADGYMTVYLTLTMAVLLSLCLMMIEGARSNAIILESEIACDIALNSVMAEYNRELMKQYNIFAIEDSYGGDNASLDNTDSHLVDYLNKNFSAKHILGPFMSYRDFLGLEVAETKTEGAMYLTDYNGDVFLRRAYEAIKDDVGLTMMSEIKDWMDKIECNNLEQIDVQNSMELLEDKAENAQAAASKDSDSGSELSGEIVESDADFVMTNPPAMFLNGLNCGIINMIIQDQSDISGRTIDASSLVYSRMKAGYVNQGNLQLEKISGIDEMAERFVFQEYLLKYMGQYKEECDDDALKYQIEYIIAGHDSDRDNLDDILTRIFAIRFAASFIYVQSDDEKKETAELLATILSIITYTEELEDVYEQLFLMYWAGCEAIYDVRCLLEGNRIELFKNEDNWHTSIFTGTGDSEYSGDDTGLSYTDYLRIFMLMMKRENLVGRAMDIVEANIRKTQGNSKFRLDACIDTIQVFIEVQSTFGYRYSFRLKRKYE